MKYNDPLHISYEQLTIYYNGGAQYMLSKSLLDRQNAWNHLDELKEAHILKLTIYDMISEETDPDMLRSLGNDLTLIEYELQTLWGFTQDIRYHRFWEYPKCTCPKLDNIDMYPYRAIHALDCPLHGAV